MLLFKKTEDLQTYLQQQRQKGQRIGFAPTMGALHQGHLSLIENAQKENEVTVCSIFVNPTQFTDKSDLEKYPRPIAQDIHLLETAGCNVLFLPAVEEIYPPDLLATGKYIDFSTLIDLGYLDKPMEGAKRPGHFKGVVQVVHRLLDIVKPDALYMGQKDYQQFTVIKSMLRQMNSPIRLVRVPIMRESDGLAMSSRNVRLSPEGRSAAAFISAALFQAQKNATTQSISELESQVLAAFRQNDFEVDYLEFVNADTLETVKNWTDALAVVACTVVVMDGVRLLDNVVLKE